MDRIMLASTITQTVTSDMQERFRETAEHFSATRDTFTARMQSYTIETNKYLEAAIIGEIGNNTFDHNFVFEDDCPRGVYCNFSYLQEYVVLADYGKGVKRSLSLVLPDIKTDREAMEIAFTRRISGRSPEQRGNGLKFVSETIRQNNWQLYFQSGLGTCFIDKNDISFSEATVNVSGCLAIIRF
jgi:hypothetical protein